MIDATLLEVTASAVSEICPAIETWETGNRWLEEERRSAAKVRQAADEGNQRENGQEGRGGGVT